MKTLAKWTVEDYHRLIEAGLLAARRVELLQGEIVQMAPKGPLHSYMTDGLADYLRRKLSDRAIVREAHPITLSDSEPEPDLAIVRLPRSQYRDRRPYAEDIFWLVEIANSTLEYDLNDKKKIYARARIPEYWVVDVKGKRVLIFQGPQGEDYQFELAVGQGNIAPLAFSDLALSVEGLWQ
ncbi:MAG: Uma2 family endonuclease [Oscillatoria sp. SIO1A7]|nr:Uma2 family endonuclease [Oscillatoria sp. SIO1A7]